MADERESEQAAVGWQPIETAPKDGSYVLLGRFTGSGDKKKDRDEYQAVDWWRRASDRRGFIGFGEFNERFWPPTHWQPLPTPPDHLPDKDQA